MFMVEIEDRFSAELVYDQMCLVFVFALMACHINVFLID